MKTVLIAISLVAVCTTQLRSEGADATTPAKSSDTVNARRFPIAVGDRWVYESGDSADKKEVAFQVTGTKDAESGKVFVVRRTIDSASVDFHLAVTEDGVYIHREGDKQYSPPLRQFAFFAKTSDSWKWSGEFGGEKRSEHFENLGVQKVSVPAGEYEAVVIQQTNQDTGDHATYWLAEGIGVVHLSGKIEIAPDSKEKVVFEWRLIRYEKK